MNVKNRQTASMEPMEKSLMMSAGQMGMSAQDVADVVAFLKVNAQEMTSGTKQSNSGAILASTAPPKETNTELISVPKPYQLGKDGRDMQNAPKVMWGDTTGKKRILFIAGNTVHRHGFHEYRAGSILLANALNASGLPVEARVHWYGWPEDESILDGVDALVLYADSGGNLTAEQYATLDQKRKKGMGLMMIHYALHPEEAYREKYYKPWLGGYFDDAFTVNSTWIADLKVNKDLPTSNGIQNDIRILDELYFCMNFEDSAEFIPLAQATPIHENMLRYGSRKFWNTQAEEQLGKLQTLMWAKETEKGLRSASFVGGHFHLNWAIDDFRKLTLNTITWISGLDVPKEGVQSKPLTQEDLNLNLNRPEGQDPVLLPTPEIYEFTPAKKYEIGPDGRAIDPRKKKK